MKTFFALVGAVVVGVLVIGIFVVIGSNNASSNATVTPADPAPSASDEPSIDVSPYRLYADYHRNEVSADSMYKGRTLKLTGAVESINKNAFDEIYVVLADGNEFSGVQAKLQPTEAPKAAQLSRGEEVTLVCKGATMIVGTPMLEDCIFSLAEPPQQVSPTRSSASAEQVAAQQPGAEQPTAQQAAAQQPAPEQTVPAVASTPLPSENQ